MARFSGVVRSCRAKRVARRCLTLGERPARASLPRTAGTALADIDNDVIPSPAKTGRVRDRT